MKRERERESRRNVARRKRGEIEFPEHKEGGREREREINRTRTVLRPSFWYALLPHAHSSPAAVAARTCVCPAPIVVIITSRSASSRFGCSQGSESPGDSESGHGEG